MTATNRLRLIQMVVNPVFVVDDGENLTPIQVQPITVSAAEWPDVVAKVAEATDDLQARIEAEGGTITEKDGDT